MWSHETSGATVVTPRPHRTDQPTSTNAFNRGSRTQPDRVREELFSNQGMESTEMLAVLGTGASPQRYLLACEPAVHLDLSLVRMKLPNLLAAVDTTFDCDGLIADISHGRPV